ncbi:MAG: serine/threonine protein kinase [bacterium]|nr:serine/threonine protein kinase [bacterium]
MQPNSDTKLSALFSEAVQLGHAERDSLLARVNAVDPTLAEDLRALLAADEHEGKLPEEPLLQALPGSLAAAAAGRGRDDDATRAKALEEIRTFAPPRARYEVAEEIGRGAMGVVRTTWDRALERSLAMKMLRPDGADQGASGAFVRFVEEARVTGQLEHPGIVPVHDIGVDDQGNVFFTMQRVHGRDLSTVFELASNGEEGWSHTRVLGLLQRVCEAMSYAHDKGVLHRDLKPANVMAGRFGEVYVMDWGIARVRGRADGHDLRLRRGEKAPESPVVTLDGAVVGTPYYMPPEQALGKRDETDVRSDIYAVGAMLYELLAGRQPYHEPDSVNTPNAILLRIVQGPPQPLEGLARGAPAELIAICAKAMAWDPAQRYSDMTRLADDLRAFLEDRVVTAHATGALAEMRKWVQRNRTAAMLAALLIASILTGLGGFSYVEARSSAELAGMNTDLVAEAKKANSIKEFLIDVLSAANPDLGNPSDLKVRDLLAQSEERLEEQLADEPKIRAELHEVISDAYRVLAMMPETKRHKQIALDIHKDLSPGDDVIKARLMIDIADTGVTTARTHDELTSDIELVSRGLAMAKRVTGELSHLSKVGEGTLTALRIKAGARGDKFFDTAVDFPFSMADGKHTREEVHEYLVRLPGQLTSAWEEGRLDDLRSLSREHAQRYLDDPKMAYMVPIAYARYAAYLAAIGQPTAAEATLHKVLTMGAEVHTPDAPQLALLRRSVAEQHADAGRVDIALPLFREALAFYTEHMGPTDELTLETRVLLARIAPEGDQLLDEGLALVRTELKATDDAYVLVALAAAEQHVRADDPDAARALCEECLPALIDAGRRGAANLAQVRLVLGRVLVASGDDEGAERALTAALEWAGARKSATRRALRAEVIEVLAALYERQGRSAAASALSEQD